MNETQKRTLVFHFHNGFVKIMAKVTNFYCVVLAYEAWQKIANLATISVLNCLKTILKVSWNLKHNQTFSLWHINIITIIIIRIFQFITSHI